jgi:DNA-binding SARP family transcriptional activator
MASLKIYLFGAFDVYQGDRRLVKQDWRGQQNRTLLKLLLTHRGHPVMTEQLLELLWPGEPPDQTRSRLYVRMSQVRRLLDAEDAAAFIVSEGGGYVWDPRSMCWLDVVAFEAHVKQGEEHQGAGDWEAAIRAYESARSLYRGDYLEEDRYADWTMGERERLRERFLTALMGLAECYAKQGRYRRALARCQQVLGADPCREAVYVRMMLYAYYAGERVRALRLYERCRAVLKEDLQVDPQASTTHLAMQIREGTLWSASEHSRYPPPVYEGRLFEVPYVLGDVPLVGRDREYAWLVARWRDPDARVILVEGAAGVGKSRLVQEFLGYARDEGCEVRQVWTSTEPEVLPYGPLVSMLRDGLRESVGVLSPDQSSALQEIFPDIGDYVPGLPSLPEIPADDAQQRLEDALLRLVDAATAERTVLCIEDAHHADAATLRLLSRIAEIRTVILTCRSEETPADHPLRWLMRQLRVRGLAARLVLDPLRPEDVRLLLTRLSHNPDLPIVTWMESAAQGNPLFLIASLQHMFEEGWLYVDDQGGGAATEREPVGVAPTVVEVIAQRLRGLRREMRHVVDVAVVAGGAFDFGLLASVSTLGEDMLLDVIDRLLDRHLLVEPRRPDRPDFALAYARYTEVAYAMIPEVRCRHLHRQIAGALRELTVDLDAIAGTLAHHYERGRAYDEAFRWLVRAAEVAQRRYALSEALAFCRRALALPGGERGPVLMMMGHLAHQLARYDEGADDYEQALIRWQALREPTREIEAHYGASECYREMSVFDKALVHAQAGLDQARGLEGDAELELVARGHIIVSNAMRSGQLGAGSTIRRHLEEAFDLAESIEAWRLMGEATFWLGVVTVNAGDPRGALGYGRQAQRCFARVQASGWEAITLNNLAYHGLLAGEARQALSWAEEGLRLTKRLHLRHSQGWLMSTLGEIQTHLGQLTEAAQTLAEGLALVRRWGPRRLRPGFLHDLAQVALARGEGARALTYLGEALSLARESAPQFVPRLQVARAEAYRSLGAFDHALEEADAASEGAQRKGQRSVAGQAIRVRAQVHAAQGQVEEVERAFARSLTLFEEGEDRLEWARTESAWGRWLFDRGDAAAQPRLERAREVFEACNAALDLARLGLKAQ